MTAPPALAHGRPPHSEILSAPASYPVTMPTQLGAALVLTEPEIRQLLTPAACIAAVERAFTSYAQGAAELPGVIHLDIPDAQGEIHIKAGYLHATPWYAVKFASGFPGNS